MQEAVSESIILIFVSFFFFSCNLSKCFDLFMKNDCLPRACKIQGNVHVFLYLFFSVLVRSLF